MFSARSRSAPYLLALVAATAFSLKAAEVTPHVELKRRAMVLVPSRSSLSAICPSQHAIEGCSLFTGERLVSRCKADGGRWRIEAKVRVEVSIYLWKPSRLGHEDLHIRDVTRWLEEYANSISGARFETRETCEEWGTRKAEAFPSLLNALKQRSNELRDPVAYSASVNKKH